MRLWLVLVCCLHQVWEGASLCAMYSVEYATTRAKTLEHPLYNNYYGSFEDKCWVISGSDVSLTVEYLDVGPWPSLETNCTGDRLEIRDGGGIGQVTGGVLLATLCGTITRGDSAATFSGATDNIQVRFRSFLQNSPEGHRGFEIRYNKPDSYFIDAGTSLFSYIGGVLVSLVVLAFMLSFCRYQARYGNSAYCWNHWNGRYGNRRNVVVAHPGMETQVSVVHTETTFQASPSGYMVPPPGYSLHPPPYSNVTQSSIPTYGMPPPPYSALGPGLAPGPPGFVTQQPGCIQQQQGMGNQHPGAAAQQPQIVPQQPRMAAQR